MQTNTSLPESSTKLTSGLSTRLSKHFATGAVAAVVATAAPASAAIIYVSANITIPSTTAGVYINVVTGVSNTTPGSVPGWDLNPWSTTTINIYANNSASPNDGVFEGSGFSVILADNLPPGTLIDGTGTYGRTPGPETTGATAFIPSSTGNIVGFRFLNETTAAINYGWARVSLGATFGGQPRSITEYAYENTGASILAGAVPEPATFSLFGVCALFYFRRRR